MTYRSGAKRLSALIKFGKALPFPLKFGSLGRQTSFEKALRLACTGCSKKTDPLVYFDDNFGNMDQFELFFHCYNKKFITHMSKSKLFQPPHLYYVATLPSEINTDTGISATCLS